MQGIPTTLGMDTSIGGVRPGRIRLKRPDGTQVEIEGSDHVRDLISLLQNRANYQPTQAGMQADQQEAEAQRLIGYVRALNDNPVPERQAPELPAYPQRPMLPMPREDRPSINPVAGVGAVLSGFVSPENAGNVYASAVNGSLQSVNESMARRQETYANAVAHEVRAFQDRLNSRNEEVKQRQLDKEIEFDNSIRKREGLIRKATLDTDAAVANTLSASARQRDLQEQKFNQSNANLQGYEGGIKLGNETSLVDSQVKQNLAHGNLLQSQARATDLTTPAEVANTTARTGLLQAQTTGQLNENSLFPGKKREQDLKNNSIEEDLRQSKGLYNLKRDQFVAQTDNLKADAQLARARAHAANVEAGQIEVGAADIRAALSTVAGPLRQAAMNLRDAHRAYESSENERLGYLAKWEKDNKGRKVPPPAMWVIVPDGKNPDGTPKFTKVRVFNDPVYKGFEQKSDEAVRHLADADQEFRDFQSQMQDITQKVQAHSPALGNNPVLPQVGNLGPVDPTLDPGIRVQKYPGKGRNRGSDFSKTATGDLLSKLGNKLKGGK